MTLIDKNPLHHPDPELQLMLDLARTLVPADEVSCPECGLDGDHQSPVRVGRDGAFDRIDYDCDGCRTHHPIWVG